VIMGYWRSMRSRDLEGLNWLPQEAMRLMFTLQAVRAVAEAYPDATVVIRPHPFEEHELYSMGFSDLPNVEINSRGLSMEAIAGADVFFHCRSNTGFEARALGVPTASLVPDRSPQTLPVDKTSSELSTIEEVMQFVRGAFDGTADQPPVSDEEFEFALGACRGDSTRRVVEGLLEIAKRTTSVPSIMRLPHKRWIREWEAVLRKRWVADDRERRKAFFASDVQEWLNRWSSAHNRRRLKARNVVGRPLIDPPVMIGGAPLAVEVTPA
ncbi:MAG TPA: hypothetical protein VG778_03690, partial [Blastocatellia bacterium]|nr:hypothetical protein [Blastocatellia bacterium]